ARTTRIVEQTVEPAVFSHREVNQRFHIRLTGDIRPDEVDTRSEPPSDGVAFSLPPCSHDDKGAFLHDAFDRPFADPARYPRDDGHLPVQSAHVFSSGRRLGY